MWPILQEKLPSVLKVESIGTGLAATEAGKVATLGVMGLHGADYTLWRC